MPRTSPFDITLTKHERSVLEAMARSYTSLYRDVVRAKMILYAADGQQNKDIAARLDTFPQIVSKWRKRFFEKRLEALEGVGDGLFAGAHAGPELFETLGAVVEGGEEAFFDGGGGGVGMGATDLD